jgi:Trk K+ transport system NAD-binding subunit
MPGAFPGLEEVNRLIRLGRAIVVEYSVADQAGIAGKTLAELSYAEGEFAVVLLRGDSIYVASGDLKLAVKDRLFCLRTTKEESPLATMSHVEREIDGKGIKQLRKAEQ